MDQAENGFINVGEVDLLPAVRYEKTVSVGDQYISQTIEGSADDVLKVIKNLELDNDQAIRT